MKKMNRRGFLGGMLASAAGVVTCVVGKPAPVKAITFPLTPPGGASVAAPPLTTSLENKMLEHLFDAMPADQTFYIGLTTTDGKEVSGNGYTRQKIQVTPELQSGLIHVSKSKFVCSDGDGWGWVSGFKIYNNMDNPLFEGGMVSTIRVGDGDTIRLDNVQITID